MDRWDRQIHALGAPAMQRLANASFVFVGVSPTSVEAARCLLLSGCRSVVFCDDHVPSSHDIEGIFFLQPSDLTESRDDAPCRISSLLHRRMHLLNPKADIFSISESDFVSQALSSSQSGGFSLNVSPCSGEAPQIVQVTMVVATNTFSCCSLNIEDVLLELNQRHRNHCGFLVAACNNFAAAMMNDFGDHFVSQDPSGRPQATSLPVDGSPCIEELSGLVVIRFPVSALDSDDFASLQPPWRLSMFFLDDGAAVVDVGVFVICQNERASDFVVVKGTLPVDCQAVAGRKLFGRAFCPPLTTRFVPLSADALRLVPSDWSRRGATKLNGMTGDALLPLTLLGTLFLRDPSLRERHLSDVAHLNGLPNSCMCDASEAISLIESFKRCPRVPFAPLASLVGALVANEAMCFASKKFIPMSVPMVLDQRKISALTSSMSDHTMSENSESALLQLFGPKCAASLLNARVFVVGAGAIGCEYLGALALTGMGSGKKANVVVTDPDSIEVSNLSRQFLFHDTDVGQSKARVAATAVKQKLKTLKVRVFNEKVDNASTVSPGKFDEQFFSSIDVICSAVDNNAARAFLDELSQLYELPLVDSGTMGSDGHVVVAVPQVTKRISDYGALSEQSGAAIPFCTLHYSPTNIAHCVQWALDFFASLFALPHGMPTLEPCALKRCLDETTDVGKLSAWVVTMERLNALLTGDAHIEALVMARSLFEAHFVAPINQRNSDSQQSNNAGSDRIPLLKVPEFDVDDELSAVFVASVASLFLQQYLGQIVDMPSLISLLRCQRELVERRLWAGTSSPHADSDDEVRVALGKGAIQRLGQEIHAFLRGGVPPNAPVPIYFDKDDTTQRHVAFVFSASNLRATVHRIPVESAMNIKRIAGRIVPALITTTVCVTSYAVMQLMVLLIGLSERDNKDHSTKIVASLRDVNLSLQDVLGNSFEMETTRVNLNDSRNTWSMIRLVNLKKDVSFVELMALLEANPVVQALLGPSGDARWTLLIVVDRATSMILFDKHSGGCDIQDFVVLEWLEALLSKFQGHTKVPKQPLRLKRRVLVVTVGNESGHQFTLPPVLVSLR